MFLGGQLLVKKWSLFISEDIQQELFSKTFFLHFLIGLVLLSISSSSLLAQADRADSLKTILSSTQGFDERNQTLRDLAQLLRFRNNAEALEFANQRLQLATDNTSQVNVAASYLQMGQVYALGNDKAETIANSIEAGNVYSCLNNLQGQVTAINTIASVYKDFGEYDSALYFFDQALDLASPLEDRHKRAIPDNMAITYYRLDQYEKP